MKYPKYTILIPTRNGGKYVIFAIQSVLAQPYESVEVIVSVNHSDDDSLIKIAEISDPRLTIIVPPEPLSMAKHYEWCLRHAKGEWVTILGDDDAVMPYFFVEVERLMRQWSNLNIEAISFRRAYYFWEGLRAIYGNSVVSFSAQSKSRLISGEKVVLGAIIGINEHFDLPQIYTNNLVHKDVIKKVLNQSSGSFYQDITPDVYSGVAVALNAKNILRSEVPVFWTGSSPKSVGVAIKVNSKDNAEKLSKSKSRSQEFFELAKKDSLGVAKEVGNRVWKAAQSSPIYVLSGLVNYQKHVPKWGKFQRSLICLGFSAAIVKSYKNKDKKQKTNLYYTICEQIEKIGINNIYLIINSFLILLIYVLNFIIQNFKAVLKKLGIIKVLTFHSNYHQDFPNILTADDKVSEYYKSIVKNRRVN